MYNISYNLALEKFEFWTHNITEIVSGKIIQKTILLFMQTTITIKTRVYQNNLNSVLILSIIKCI